MQQCIWVFFLLRQRHLLLKPGKLHRTDGFIRLGRHEIVQLGVPGEAVFKGDDVSGTANQATACGHIGDVPHLCFRDVQKPCQFLSIGGRLIQQDEELRVRQHKAGGIRTQNFIHVLRQPGHESVVFADPFPELVEEVCTVLVACLIRFILALARPPLSAVKSSHR